MVRELFEMARTKKACIIFFDEIDAIGGARFDDGAGGVTTKCNERCWSSSTSWMVSIPEGISRFSWPLTGPFISFVPKNDAHDTLDLTRSIPPSYGLVDWIVA